MGILGFSCGSAGKESTCNARDLGPIPGLGRSPEEGKGYPFQYSGLENSTDCIVYGVAKNHTCLSDFHFSPTLFFGTSSCLNRKGEDRDSRNLPQVCPPVVPGFHY